MENVKKTFSLAGGKRKENVTKTSRNRTAREAPKRHFRQTHVSYLKPLQKNYQKCQSWQPCAPGPAWPRKRKENVKKT